ncbi:MAG: TIGR04076 family protein [Alphaproteobacteria bacterium]|nr:TIGR04076 family protein [Alphaproteobacteria bacterium]MBF0249276.1 TIGR04076 family protein [Alphaproteobacteria bacterium]
MVSTPNVTLTHISGGCKYHRTVGERFRLQDLAPEGLCLHAYFTAYPYILGMLHKVEFDWMKDNPDHVYAQCPALSSPRILDIHREIDAEGRFHVRVSVDGINDAVDIPGAIRCDCPHGGGETFEVNQGDGNGFCPAAFNQLFPYLSSFLNGGQSQFLPQGHEFIGVCPDNNNNVTFKIAKEDV